MSELNLPRQLSVRNNGRVLYKVRYGFSRDGWRITVYVPTLGAVGHNLRQGWWPAARYATDGYVKQPAQAALLQFYSEWAACALEAAGYKPFEVVRRKSNGQPKVK